MTMIAVIHRGRRPFLARAGLRSRGGGTGYDAPDNVIGSGICGIGACNGTLSATAAGFGD
jgi:hypothetical protein